MITASVAEALAVFFLCWFAFDRYSAAMALK